MTRRNVELVPVEPGSPQTVEKRRAKVALGDGEAAAITAWRLAVLANGYTPIPTRDKRTLLKGWNALNPTASDIADWLNPRADVAFYSATGLLVVNRLVPIDGDLPDIGIAHEARLAIQMIAPQLFEAPQKALERGRDDGSPKFMLFARRAADAAPFTVKSRKWSLSPEDEDAPTFQVEIFASDRNRDGLAARQVGAFGSHTVDDETGTVKVRYDWKGPSPVDVPLADLPVLTKDQALAIAAELDRIMEARGYKPVKGYRGGLSKPEDVYDLDDKKRFDGEDFSQITLDELIEVYWQNENFGGTRCSGSFTGQGGTRLDRCQVGWSGSKTDGHITVHDYATEKTHRPVAEESMTQEAFERSLRELFELLGPANDNETLFKRPPPPPIIKYGPLSRMADQAAETLLEAKVPFYQRGDKLVRPVVVPAQTFHGKNTTAAQLVEVELPYMRDMLCRKSQWVKFDGRMKKWKAAHPSPDAAQVLLKRFGDWEFPIIAGIITTPTLRPDGSILRDAGYDPVTQLLLIDPPPMPAIADDPARDDAVAALELLSGLLVEFGFDDDKGVSRAVALSAIVSTVCRGAYPVLPMHVFTAPAPGSGKSYLLSTVSLIATGLEMPVLGTGKSEEEMEKRIGAELIHGQSLICIDNVESELGGEALCQLIEQHRPSVRILGKSQNVEARGSTFFADGNNLILRSDVCRRALLGRLDSKMERPELRTFKHNPKQMVLADRGKYIAACLTIARAYIGAGRPNKCPQLGSFNEWSDTVRSALVWLGEADPVGSMDASKAADPDTVGLLTMLNAWVALFGKGAGCAVSARTVIERCEANNVSPLGDVFGGGKTYDHPELRNAVLAVMPPQHSFRPDANALGAWLRSRKDRRVGKLRFMNRSATGHSPTLWRVEEEQSGDATVL